MRRGHLNPDLPKGNIKKLYQILVYLKPHKRNLIGVFLALITSSGAVLSIGQGLKYLVDKGLGSQSTYLLDQALLCLLGIIIILAIATYFRFYLITKVGEHVVANIRSDIYKRLINLSPVFFETRKLGEIMSRLTTDTTVLQVVIGSSLSIALRNILLFSGGLILLIMTSPKLAGYIAIMIPLVILPVLILGKKVRRLSGRAQTKIAEISSQIDESLSGIKTVQAYNQEENECRNFYAKVDDALSAAMDRVKVRAILTALVILVAFGAIGAVLWMGGRSVIIGEITAGELSSFVFYSILVASSFGALSEVVGDIQRAAGAAEGLMELLNTTSGITDENASQKLPTDDGKSLYGKVQFDNITFNYLSRPDEPSLKDLSFIANSGETVAIVGPSGAGKTTVLQLLLRFYDPQNGAISIDDIDIRNLKLDDLRGQFAYVSQDTMIFSTTARQNIAYGNPDASDEEVIAAAKRARAYDFIEKLPDGFNSYLGEKGTRLSGGERQRIAIARAILKNPRILLLDEATSALDSENEKLVQEALEELMSNRTTIIIAHRLSTILTADKILVLNDGKLEAVGTHEELLTEGNLYKRLAELQFAGSSS